MKIELVKYEKKHLPKIILGSLNWASLKSAGFFDKDNLGKIIKHYLHEKVGYYFTILMDGKIVGTLNFIEGDNSNSFSLGISVFKKYWNNGIAGIAIKKSLNIARSFGIKEITAVTFLDNFASEKVLRKNKFEKVRIDEKNNYWRKDL